MSVVSKLYNYNNTSFMQEQDTTSINSQSFSPSSSSSSSSRLYTFNHANTRQQQQRPNANPSKNSTQPSSSSGTLLKSQQTWNFTWLVFMYEKWVPFDMMNQTKLEQTLTVGGTFVDITDTHFPAVKRVRVFPKNNYLSYLGVKYRLSRIMQPDAYLDHVSVAKAKQTLSLLEDD